VRVHVAFTPDEAGEAPVVVGWERTAVRIEGSMSAPRRASSSSRTAAEIRRH
jgi:hypothetical protein